LTKPPAAARAGTALQAVWLPVARAAIELRRHNPPRAIQILEAVRPYEAAAQFWPAYLRGQADLAEGAGAEAAAQFQYIIDHRGQEPTSPRYPLAHLGLSRAARLNSDTAKSRQAYQNFFALRKESDAYLTELIAARREHEEME
jgi:eukaryotic-like serine/threonine-protein kinase